MQRLPSFHLRHHMSRQCNQTKHQQYHSHGQYRQSQHESSRGDDDEQRPFAASHDHVKKCVKEPEDYEEAGGQDCWQCTKEAGETAFVPKGFERLGDHG